MLTVKQQVFTIFFAIFWGVVANVQPRWKAFQFPLIRDMVNVRWRVSAAVLILNILPILYFGIILSLLKNNKSGINSIVHILINSVIPAIGIFGIYRLWIAIIEWRPDLFYKRNIDLVPKKYQHVEPTYSLEYSDSKYPVVSIAEGACFGNFITALVYIAIGLITACV